ncbi:helix-turn-helix domain-containing protein [Rhodococcus sp. ABRD24]|uniref:winged helix-turn-helix transcriptional regulator n=1 Tax=Rhodococcus sp. ABRD24 TaxID=2507582 RepID=UPI001A955550|nr:helix-turn-helix domain-containing protein [Rhodococcus sp. ABRD24]
MGTSEAGDVLEPGGDNAVAITLGILGDEWNLWILAEALRGTCRYSDWLSRGPISNSVLTGRLARLTEAGLFERVRLVQSPVRYQYVLTDRGRAVWPILMAMWSWEKRWGPDGLASRMVVRHKACGSEFTPILVCAHCCEPAARDDVVVRLGPSGAGSRSIPAASSRRRSGSAARLPAHLPHTMELLGNRWSAAMLGVAFLGATRYREFEERMGASTAIVADRLRTFTGLGVFRAESAPERSDRVTYHLTEKGWNFFPVVVGMMAWGQWWFRAPEGDALLFWHRSCRGSFAPRLVCSECAQPLQAREIVIGS